MAAMAEIVSRHAVHMKSQPIGSSVHVACSRDSQLRRALEGGAM
jgi:hypothetical protein